MFLLSSIVEAGNVLYHHPETLHVSITSVKLFYVHVFQCGCYWSSYISMSWCYVRPVEACQLMSETFGSRPRCIWLHALATRHTISNTNCNKSSKLTNSFWKGNWIRRKQTVCLSLQQKLSEATFLCCTSVPSFSMFFVPGPDEEILNDQTYIFHHFVHQVMHQHVDFWPAMSHVF